MNKYPKIQNVFTRDHKTKQIELGSFSKPEFEYLADSIWTFHEKVDGTNIRIIYEPNTKPEIRGRTDGATLPPHLLSWLKQFQTPEFVERLEYYFPDPNKIVTFYGEGYGTKIQKRGHLYNPDGVGFTLFDIKINDAYLPQDLVNWFAGQLYMEHTPIVEEGTLYDGLSVVSEGFESCWGSFRAEGVVARPKIEMMNRFGERVITKIKDVDFGDTHLNLSDLYHQVQSRKFHSIIEEENAIASIA